jgi:hypothetical protein
VRVDLDGVKLVGEVVWEIRYVNDTSGRRWCGGSLPEAYTVGICKFNRLDLCLRKITPPVASGVLDRVGLWLLSSGHKLVVGDVLVVGGVCYGVVPALDVMNRPVFRLSWGRDPEPSEDVLDRILPVFSRALNKSVD